MDLGFLFGLIVIGAVLSAFGSLVWWIFVILVARKAVSSSASEMEQLFKRMAQEIQSVSHLPRSERAAHQPDIAALMLRANTQMRQLDNLARQRYETRMGDLMSQAAQAGISWTPPSY
jgi:hypothetical protein